MSSYSQRTLVGQAVSSFGKGSGEPAMITKVDRFTADGTFTPPAGVTYAIAHMRGGGGGMGGSGQGAGGTSSVAFAGGTVSATGGAPFSLGSFSGVTAGAANSGHGGQVVSSGVVQFAEIGLEIVAGGAVTPGTGITVTVGAGGVAGSGPGAAGGSGYVWIEYQV